MCFLHTPDPSLSRAYAFSSENTRLSPSSPMCISAYYAEWHMRCTVHIDTAGLPFSQQSRITYTTVVIQARLFRHLLWKTCPEQPQKNMQFCTVLICRFKEFSYHAALCAKKIFPFQRKSACYKGGYFPCLFLLISKSWNCSKILKFFFNLFQILFFRTSFFQFIFQHALFTMLFYTGSTICSKKHLWRGS